MALKASHWLTHLHLVVGKFKYLNDILLGFNFFFRSSG